MDRREREAMFGQQKWQGADVRDRRIAETLERDVAETPLRGRPLRHRLRASGPRADSYIASLGGPLPYMARLRQIEDEIAEHERRLSARYGELAAEAPDAAALERAWADTVEGWSFVAVNALIERHNRWYPVEARLPMDPGTGDFALVNGSRYELEPLDAAWALQRVPTPGRDGEPRRG